MMNLNRSKSDLFHRRKVHQERELDSLPIKGSSMNSHENYIFGKQLKSRNNLDPQNKSIKRAELLSQLPSSTKVSTVLVVEPTSSFPIKNKVLPNTIIDSLQSTGENISEDEYIVMVKNKTIAVNSFFPLNIESARACSVFQKFRGHFFAFTPFTGTF